MINAAAARKSVARTSAPDNTDAPLITAVCESIRNCAPIRRISSKWLKRFSNTVSVIVLVPVANNCAIVICACISVGKPG